MMLVHSSTTPDNGNNINRRQSGFQHSLCYISEPEGASCDPQGPVSSGGIFCSRYHPDDKCVVLDEPIILQIEPSQDTRVAAPKDLKG